MFAARLQAHPARLAVDTLFAAVFIAGVTAATWRIASGPGDAVGAGGVACIVAAGLPLAVRRVWPVAVLAAVTLAISVYALADFPGGPVYTAQIVAIYSVASQRPRATSIWLAVGSMAVLFLAVMAGQGVSSAGGWIHIAFISWGAVALFLGDATRNRQRYLESLRERARQAEETRDEEARRRVAEERVRIARDVHDVVAHSLATVAVQSAAGLRVIDKDSEAARDALAAIRETSKQALGELRATVELLRQGEEAAPLHPAPGLADTDALFHGMARAGLDVRLDVRGQPQTLPPAVDLTAYRILQESLTNVVRHSSARTVDVTISYTPEGVELQVLDDGRPLPGANVAGGHGIAGMRERAMSAGGVLRAGPCDAGGFAVWARLPADGPA